MTNLPWICFIECQGEIRLLQRRAAIQSLLLAPKKGLQKPVLVAVIGGGQKNTLLRRALSIQNGCGNHGGVQVCVNARHRRLPQPIVFLDCELHAGKPSKQVGRYCGPCDRVQTINAPVQPNPDAIHRLALQLYAKVLQPFIHVLCLFTADLGGVEGLAQFIATWIESTPKPLRQPPRLLVCNELGLSGSDGRLTQTQLVDAVAARLQRTTNEVSRLIRTHFGEWQTVKTDLAPAFPDDAIEMIQETASGIKRGSEPTNFKIQTSHLQSFFDRACDDFVLNRTRKTSPIELMRRDRKTPAAFRRHMMELFCVLAARGIAAESLEAVVARWTASAMTLDAYPPGTPCKCK